MNSKQPFYRILSLSLCFLSVGFTAACFAGPMHHTSESSLHVSRYVESTPGPTEAQHNPLHIVIPRVRFGHNVKSVGQAINALLIDTGYRLARYHPDKRVEHMLQLHLPDIHRNMGPLTLEQALKTLVSNPWMLSVDPIHRLVSYELPGLYKQAVPVKRKTVNRQANKKKINSKQHQKRPVTKRINKSHKKPVKYDWNDIEQLFSGDD